MKLLDIAVIMSITVISGCQTLGPRSGDIISDIERIDAKDGRDDVQPFLISDNNFSYTMGDNHTRSFKRVNPKASLNDLNDFVYAKCWNGYLHPKLENGQKLTREDAVLLSFCVNVQLNMVDTLAVATLGDMTDPGYLHSFVVKAAEESHEKNLEGIDGEQNQVFVDLKMNFINGQEGVRLPIRQWAAEYNVVPRDIMSRIYLDVERATNPIDKSDGSTFFDAHPWLWSSAYIASSAVPVLDFIGGMVGVWQATTPSLPNALEEGAMRLNVPVVDLRNKWRNARDEMTVYLQEMTGMRKELKLIRSDGGQQDSQTREFLQRILSESDNDYAAVSQYLDYSMYDVPFSVLTYKALGGLKKCKGRFDDDEDAMKAVMSEYVQAISGTEMIRHIRTRYAANGYAEAQKFLESELYESDFKSFVHESKLYNIDQKLDDLGRPNNVLQLINPEK